MEQQNTTASTSSHTTEPVIPAQPHSHKYQQHSHQTQRKRDTRSPSSSPSVPASVDSPAQDLLSSSELSLRFPRPVGSRHLANWITTSDPDIMRFESQPTEDDEGLSNSTYEIIYGVDDSEWSHGTDHEDMSESVNSLPARRSDDVQSLPDTDRMTDDEVPPIRYMTDYRSTPMASQHALGHSIHLHDGSDSDSDEEEIASRSSIDYAQESLKTPSMNTPEASKVLIPNSSFIEWVQGFFAGGYQYLRDAVADARRNLKDEGLRDRFSPYSAILIVVGFVCFCMPFFININSFQAPVAPAVTTIAPAVAPPSTTLPTPVPTSKALATIPREENSVQWIFSLKKPQISVAEFQKNSILISGLPEGNKEGWLSENCFSLDVIRDDGTPVPYIMAPVREGLLIKFPRRERHGLLHLTFLTSCKSPLETQVTIDFGQGIWETAFAVKNIVAEILPATERGLEEAKNAIVPYLTSAGEYKSPLFDVVEDALHRIMLKVDGSWASLQRELPERVFKLSKSFWSRTDLMSRELMTGKEHALNAVRDAQVGLQLQLLNAQISARLAWLAAIGRAEEHDEYLRKAAVFLERKRAEAKSTGGSTAKPAQTKARPRAQRPGRSCRSC